MREKQQQQPYTHILMPFMHPPCTHLCTLHAPSMHSSMHHPCTHLAMHTWMQPHYLHTCTIDTPLSTIPQIYYTLFIIYEREATVAAIYPHTYAIHVPFIHLSLQYHRYIILLLLYMREKQLQARTRSAQLSIFPKPIKKE